MSAAAGLVIVVFGTILAAAAVAFNKRKVTEKVTLDLPKVDPVVPLGSPREPDWQADFSHSSIGLTSFVTEDVPPVLTGSGAWATYDRPGGQGQDCVDPGPNAYYGTENNQLMLVSRGYGWPLVATKKFDRTKSIRMDGEFLFYLNAEEDWGGLVAWNGENNYKAIYFSKALNGDTGSLTVDIWSTTKRKNTGVTVPKGFWHKFAIVYANGEFTFEVNDISIGTWKAVDGDTVAFSDDPYLAIFLGDKATMWVRNLKVWN
jgi:hypothetical protein